MHRVRKKTSTEIYNQMIMDFNLEVHNKVFQSAQMCWWYVLFGPEYCNWSKEKMLEYNRKIHEFEYGLDDLSDQDGKKSRFIEESGIDIVGMAKRVSYQTRVKMFGRKIPFDFTKIASYQTRMAIEDAIFLAAHVLYHDFNMTKTEIESIYEDVFTWMNEYRFGMNDSVWLEYFNGVGELPVIQP